jgi:hypothetical protein
MRLKLERDSEEISKLATMSVTSFRKGSWDSVIKSIHKSHGVSSTSSVQKGDKIGPVNDNPIKKPKLTGLFKHKNDPSQPWFASKSTSSSEAIGPDLMHSRVSPLE